MVVATSIVVGLLIGAFFTAICYWALVQLDRHKSEALRKINSDYINGVRGLRGLEPLDMSDWSNSEVYSKAEQLSYGSALDAPGEKGIGGY